MPEFVRSIAARLREYVGNRRRATRYRVRLAVSVSLVETKKVVNGPRHAASLAGYTRDISTTGLALILPAIRIGDNYLTGENRTLEILIEHEAEPLVIYATSTRYEKLDEEGAVKGYLIGVKITEMSDDDRARYIAYMSKLT